MHLSFLCTFLHFSRLQKVNNVTDDICLSATLNLMTFTNEAVNLLASVSEWDTSESSRSVLREFLGGQQGELINLCNTLFH